MCAIKLEYGEWIFDDPIPVASKLIEVKTKKMLGHSIPIAYREANYYVPLKTERVLYYNKNNLFSDGDNDSLAKIILSLGDGFPVNVNLEWKKKI